MLLSSRWRKLATSALPFVIIGAVWQWFGSDSGPRSVFLPTPTTVFKALYELFRDGEFYADIGASVLRLTAAFALSALVAIPVGLMAGRSHWVALFVNPVNDFARYLPVPSLVPLCILWVGIGNENKILVIFLGTVFQLIPLVADCATTVPESFIDMGRIYGASRAQVIARVVVPWCAPTIYDHCRVALGWAWSYLVIAELVATTSGIGRVIIQAQRFIQTPKVIASILVIGILGLLFDQAFRIMRPRLFTWT